MAASTNAWFAIQRLGLGGHRWGFPVLRLSGGRDQMVGPDTEVCIEGYPRSANTFAFHGFKLRNPDLRIAHHLHAPMQVVRAVDLGVPCAALIRPPLDAISSLLIFRGGRLSPGLAIRAYEDFYARVADVRERVALCHFDDVRADPAFVARELNGVFRTAFDDQPLDEAARADLVAMIERFDRNRKPDVRRHTTPRAEKDTLKPEATRAVAEHGRFPRAEAAYERLVS
jgi:hypothetical protein